MINDIDCKRINMVVTKDLSRLGRDYILTGNYVEVYFPSKDVRYIAINDGIDTIRDDNDIAPFKAIINEMYAKDASKKVRSALKTKASQGMFLGSYAPYGYMIDPQDKHKLLVDEEAAAVVKRIYKMYLQGAGLCNITDTLNRDGIDTPRQHDMKRNPEKFKCASWQREIEWRHGTIRNALKNPTYLGHMVNGRQTTRSFKCKEPIYNDKSAWTIVENTHEPIISQEEFDEVQRMLEIRRKPTKQGTPHIFTGLVRCDECGKGLVLNNNKYTRYFSCRTYKMVGNRGCSSHGIRYDELVKAVLESIKQHIALAEIDKGAFAQKLMSEDGKNRRIRLDGFRKELDKISGREMEINGIFKHLYEDKTKGLMNDSRFVFLTGQYDSELETILKRKTELMDMLAQEEISDKGTARFMELIERHMDIQELDSAIAHELIDCIYIGKKEKGRNAIQDITIHFKFVGNIA